MKASSMTRSLGGGGRDAQPVGRDVHAGAAGDDAAVDDPHLERVAGVADHLDDHRAVTEAERVAVVDVVEQLEVVDLHDVVRCWRRCRAPCARTAPSASSTPSSGKWPARTLGPGRSTRMPTSRSRAALAARMRR